MYRGQNRRFFNTRYKDLICNAVKWLRSIDMLDNLFYDTDCILNKLTKKCFYKVKYLGSPLLIERVSFLQHMHENGYSQTTIRDAAEMQIIVMEMLNLTSLRPITTSEMYCGLDKWDSITRGNHQAHAPKGRRSFRTIATNWLRYTGMLVEETPIVVEQGKIDTYCSWLCDEKGLAEGTISVRKAELARMTNFLLSDGKSIESLCPVDIDSYLRQRSKDGCCRYTISNIVTILRDFFHYAYICKWNSCDLSCSIHGPRVFSHERLPYAPSWDDVVKLVAYYDGTSATAIRNKAVILLLTVYGLRTSEVSDIRLGDIDWTNDTITVNHKKGGRSMHYPLYPEVGNAIVRYLKESRRNDIDDRHLFLTMVPPYHGINRNNVYQIVSTAYKKAGISAKHIGGHSLRHACASNLVNSGHSLKSVADVLGHRSIDSTRAYTKLNLTSLSLVSDMNWEGLI